MRMAVLCIALSILTSEGAMARKFAKWHRKLKMIPQSYDDFRDMIIINRKFSEIAKLDYGDNGLFKARDMIVNAIKENKRIAFVVDKDTDGQTSGLSWVWYLDAIGYDNYTYYIPKRSDGYGLIPKAARHVVVNEKADLVVTADLGITARDQVRWIQSQGVEVLITDHHTPQEEYVPDCHILNPKYHADEEYRHLCGAGITYVLIRAVGEEFPVPNEVWLDILGLAGMATIADMVPLNRVNHKLAKLGIRALVKSQRPSLRMLIKEADAKYSLDETDVGFRIAPRMNVMGRLSDATKVVDAFSGDNPLPMIKEMTRLNEERKEIQRDIIERARIEARKQKDNDFLFIGGDFHTGVAGIAASTIAREFWKPTLIYNNTKELNTGSARSILGFSIVDAFGDSKHLFESQGGHVGAGGAAWKKENAEKIGFALNEFAKKEKARNPRTFVSYLAHDFVLPDHLWTIELMEHLRDLKPFGMEFPAPLFSVTGKVLTVRQMKDKKTGKPRHTSLLIEGETGNTAEVVFWNAVHVIKPGKQIEAIVSLSVNKFRGKVSLQMLAEDFQLVGTY